MSLDPATFYSRTRGARKVIVVDLGFLGDSVHLVPALWELHRNYPEAELHTLSAPVGAAVLRLAPCVTRTHAFPLAPDSPPWWRHWGVIRRLNQERFDLAINFSGADRSIFLTALSGAQWRLGHEAGRRHFWNRWLIRDWVARQSRDLPIYEQRRQVLAACGMSLGKPRWDLQIPPAASARAASLVPAGAVHFSINAISPLREWPLERWVELSKRLLAEHPQLNIVASGSAASREQARLRALAAALPDPRLGILPDDMSIAELAGALKRCLLHVGSDSGVLHVAVALGVPTIAFFRESPGMYEWLPRGPNDHHLIVPCECVGRRNPPCEPLGKPLCLERIQAEQVLELAKACLGKVLPPDRPSHFTPR